MEQKMWYQSKALVSLLVGIAVMVYKYVKLEFMPSLPMLPENIVDLIVTALIGGGIIGRVTATKTIRKKILPLLLMFCLVSGTARADIFGPQPSDKLKASSSKATVSAPFMDAGTILDYLASIAGYLGTREGGFYDFNENELCNYLAATLYTYQPAGVSFNVGALNTDGFAFTADWNAGSVIPSQDVPLLSLFQYLYIGGGLGARHLEKPDTDEKEWRAAYGVDAQFKFTF